jgi:hypothetical protein
VSVSLGSLVALVLSSSVARAQDEQGDDPSLNPFFAMSLDELLDVHYDTEKVEPLRFYGFVQTTVEREFEEEDPVEWEFPSFFFYGAADLNKRFDVLFNLAFHESAPELRNAYGNTRIADEFQIRIGVQYARFDLFNEKLDHFPTFIGIAPPELYDEEHLLVPRTALAGIHGKIADTGLSYSLQTGNGEGGPAEGVVPLWWDARYEHARFLVGTSGYASSLLGGSSLPEPEGVGRGGVLPWMAGDRYTVFGGFFEGSLGKLLLQTAYYHAFHQAQRDPQATLDLVLNAELSEGQRERFLGENAARPDAELGPQDIVSEVRYSVDAFYFRAGYTLPSSVGNWTPYGHLDVLSHPEMISDEDYGGDEEAGLMDDGAFTKLSLGVVYNPIDTVAFKFDIGHHFGDYSGTSPEQDGLLRGRTPIEQVRLDASFAFKQPGR